MPRPRLSPSQRIGHQERKPAPPAAPGAAPRRQPGRPPLPRLGPLAGLRVVEMGQLLAGPFCAQLLGDFGAEVLKIEPPGEGDPMRQWGQHAEGMGLWFPVLGRNKRSVTLDLRQKEGQALARRLVSQADILVENFRPGTLERWGLGYEALSEENGGLILVRVTGFGQTGPYAPRAGYGAIGEAMGGLRHVVGEPDRAPARAGISIGDSLAGLFAAYGAMIALHSRHNTGKGQVVDSAIYESVLAMTESLVIDYHKTGYVRERTGAILPGIAPSNVYPTRDGQSVLIAANQDTVFRRLAEVMGSPAVASDKKFSSHVARGKHQAELDRVIGDWTKTQEAAPLLETLEKAGVPAGRVYRAPDMLDDPHFAARQAIVQVPHPVLGMIAMHNVAPRLGTTPGSVRHAGPAVGADNDDVWRALVGLTDREYAKLRDKKVI